MRPLTDHIPKPMVCVNHKPLIDYVIEMCLEADIDQIIVNFHYKPKVLTDHLKKNFSDKVILSDETDLLLDSGGGVCKALGYINASEFFVINADCIWHNLENNALKQLYNAYDADKFDVCKLLANPQNAIGFEGQGIYQLDRNNYISKQAQANYEFTGIQILKRKLFDHYMPKPFSIREVWQSAFDQKHVGGCEFQGQWLHIGTPNSVTDAEAYFHNL